jgi:hypothetical protein
VSPPDSIERTVRHQVLPGVFKSKECHQAIEPRECFLIAPLG